MFPSSPDPTQNSNSTKQHQKRRVVIGAALVVVIALIGGIIHALTKTPLKNNVPFLAYNSIADVTPKQVLKVGDNRYVGACQALPPETVQAAIKPFDKATSYTEEFYPTSPTKEDTNSVTGAKASCRYLYVDADNTSLDLELEQFTTTKEAKQKWDTQRKLGNGEYRKELLEGARGGDGSELDETFKSIVNEQDIAELEARSGGIPLNGLDSDILFVAGDGSFVSYRKNVKIVLKYAFGGTASTDGSLRLSKAEAETKVAGIKQVFDTVYKNIDDQKLSQAPQRTIISDNKEVYGSRVIEPCGLLSNEMFTSATSKTANNPVTSESATNDLTRTTKNKAGQTLYPNVSCERSYTGEVKPGTIDRDSAYMNVKLAYTPSAAEAKAYLDREIDNLFTIDLDMTKSPKDLGLDLVLSKPESAADHTYLFSTEKLRDIKPGTGLIKKAFIAVDSYVVIVDVKLEATDKTPKEYAASDKTYFSVIETITKKLRSIN